MTMKTIATGLSVLTIAVAAMAPLAAQAQGAPNDHGGPGAQHGQAGPQGGPGDNHGGGDHGPAHADNGPRGPQPHADWHKGGRVPEDYRGNQYVVNDWQSRHLRRPPRGYHWVNVNGDFVLMAAATGIISQIISGR